MPVPETFDTPNIERLVLSMLFNPTAHESEPIPQVHELAAPVLDDEVVGAPVDAEPEEQPQPKPQPEKQQKQELQVVTSDPASSQEQFTTPSSIPTKEQGSSILAEILNPKILTLLSEKHSNADDLLNLSLKEILADVASKMLIGPWKTFDEEGKTRMRGSFVFEGVAAYKQSIEFAEAIANWHCPSEMQAYPLVCSVTSVSPTSCRVDIVLGSHESTELKDSDYALANFINYRYLSLKNTSPWHLYADPKQESPVDEPSSSTNSSKSSAQLGEADIVLDEASLKPVVPSIFGEAYVMKFTDEEDSKDKKMLKVPVARLGEWSHPVYKTVKFSQQDFDEIISNFQNNILGYEPPLFLGHPIDTVTSQGHPAEGFLCNLFQEADVLFSEFEVVNDDILSDVKKGRIRYSSGEFQRQYVAKETGEKVGTTLVGMALTNRPFLTRLPRVTALSEFNKSTPDPLRFQFELLTEADKPTPQEEPTSDSSPQSSYMSTQTTQPETKANEAGAVANAVQAIFAESGKQEMQQALADAVNNIREDFSKQLAGIEESHKQELSSLKSLYEQQLSEQLNKIATLESESHQKKVEEKIAHVNSLCLPNDTKQKFSEMIRQGNMGAAESALIENLQTLSDSFKQTMTSQVGQTNSTEALNDSLSDSPFKDIIERNKKQAEERRAKMGAK